MEPLLMADHLRTMRSAERCGFDIQGAAVLAAATCIALLLAFWAEDLFSATLVGPVPATVAGR